MQWMARGLVLLLLLLLLPWQGVLAQEPVTLTPYSSEAYGFSSVAPDGWITLAPGVLAQSEAPGNLVLLAQQSAPQPPEEILTSLLPQLALETAPESVGTHSGELDWTLYKVDVDLPNATLAVDLALSTADGVSYIVLLQAPTAEYDALHAEVFLPALDALTPIVEPVEDLPYDVEEVTFPQGEITLAGTLTLPEGNGPHPAIVLVSGSGPQDRDETLPGIAIKPFKLLADALTREGVAVLRYDDRGVGKSTGDFDTATTADFAADAAAAISYLTTRPEIDGGQIGLLGHSEGGLVAAMLGASNDDLAFIISLAGPGVDGQEIIRLQTRLSMLANGIPEAEVSQNIDFLEGVIARQDDPEALRSFVYEETLRLAAALSAKELQALGNLDTYAKRIAEDTVATFNSPWFTWFLSHDPAPDWAKTTVPVLAIFGGKDLQVDAAQNAPPLLAALIEGGNRDVQVSILPNANHLFQTAEVGSMSEYMTLPAEFTPDLIPLLTAWLDGHVEVAESGA